MLVIKKSFQFILLKNNMSLILSSRLAKSVKTIWEMHPKSFSSMEKSDIVSFYSPFLQTSLPRSGRSVMALLRKIQAY